MEGTFQSLQLVFRAIQHHSSTIIILPDTATPPVETWAAPHGKPWLEELRRQSALNADVYAMTAYVDAEAVDRSQSREHADVLLDDLKRFCDNDKIATQPIIVLCFGFGGIVWKQALVKADSVRSNFTSLFNALAGIAFFVTPHSTSDDVSRWSYMSLTPRIKDNIRSLERVNSSSQNLRKAVDRLTALSQSFEEVSISRPMLIGYEVRNVTYSSRMRGPQSSMIVGEHHSAIPGEAQTIVELDCDYLEAHNLSIRSSAFDAIAEFVVSSLSSAQVRIGKDASDAHLQEEDTETTTTLNGMSEQAADHETLPFTDAAIDHGRLNLPCRLYNNQNSNKVFVGRHETMARLEDCLLPTRSIRDLQVPRICSVYGVGGIGKTMLARQFMFEHAHEFEAVLWLQADQIATLRDGCSRFAAALGLVDNLGTRDQPACVNLVKGWLEKPLQRLAYTEEGDHSMVEWLLVLDNMEDPEELIDFLPRFGTGAILMTSRAGLPDSTISSTSIELDPMKPEETSDLMLQILTKVKQTDRFATSLDALAFERGLCGHPLIVAQMAGIIKRSGYTYDEFLRRIDEASLTNRVTTMTSEGVVDYGQILDRVWSLDPLMEPSSSLFDVTALLNPDHIEEDLLFAALRAADEHVEAFQLVGFPRTEAAYLEAVRELSRRSLLFRHKQHKRLWTHRLTQEAACERMNVTRLKQAFFTAVSLIGARWPFPQDMSQRHARERWMLCEKYVSHISQLHTLYTKHILKNGLFVANELFARLLIDTAAYFVERGAGETFKSLLASAEEILDSQEETPSAPELRSEIYYIRGAQAADTNNRPDLLFNNMAFLATRVELAKKSGTKDSKLAHAYNQAGNAHLESGFVDEAIEHYLTSLSIHESIPGNELSDRSIPVANLGSAYQLSQRYTEAEQILTENLRARELKFGSEDTESFITGRLLHALGNVKVDQGRFPEAFKLHLRSLSHYRRVLGETHRRTADLCYKVAEHRIRHGQYPEARRLLEQAHYIFQNRPYYRQELSRTKFLLARMFRFAHEPRLATKYSDEAVDIYRRVTRDHRRPAEELTLKDFDAIVGFASR